MLLRPLSAFFFLRTPLPHRGRSFALFRRIFSIRFQCPVRCPDRTALSVRGRVIDGLRLTRLAFFFIIPKVLLFRSYSREKLLLVPLGHPPMSAPTMLILSSSPMTSFPLTRNRTTLYTTSFPSIGSPPPFYPSRNYDSEQVSFFCFFIGYSPFRRLPAVALFRRVSSVHLFTLLFLLLVLDPLFPPKCYDPPRALGFPSFFRFCIFVSSAL